MEPKAIEDSPLSDWMMAKTRNGFIPYIVLALISYFFLKAGVILTILYVGIRTELWISSLRYGDTVNSRRLEYVEEAIGIEIDYKEIHQRKG